MELGRLNRVAVFANEADLRKENGKWTYHGDAMDVALLGMCYKLGVNPYEMRASKVLEGKIPYESEKKYAAAFCSVNGDVYVGVKGAVEKSSGFL